MKVCVNYNDARWRKYKIDFDRVANMAGNDLSPQAEVSIILTNDKEIHDALRSIGYSPLSWTTSVGRDNLRTVLTNDYYQCMGNKYSYWNDGSSIDRFSMNEEFIVCYSVDDFLEKAKYLKENDSICIEIETN